MPAVTPADAIVQATKELANTLKAKVPPPFTQPSALQIKQLCTIFTQQKNSDDEAPGLVDGADSSNDESASTDGAGNFKLDNVVPLSKGDGHKDASSPQRVRVQPTSYLPSHKSQTRPMSRAATTTDQRGITTLVDTLCGRWNQST